MNKCNHLDYKVAVPFIPQTERSYDETNLRYQWRVQSDDTIPAVYNQGTIEQYFTWLKSLNSILRGQTIMEKFRLALQTLRGTDAALGQHKWDAAIPQIVEAARIDPELQELLLQNAIMALTVHILKHPRAGFKQKRYMDKIYLPETIQLVEE
jgi:hypothetical protein